MHVHFLFVSIVFDCNRRHVPPFLKTRVLAFEKSSPRHLFQSVSALLPIVFEQTPGSFLLAQAREYSLRVEIDSFYRDGTFFAVVIHKLASHRGVRARRFDASQECSRGCLCLIIINTIDDGNITIICHHHRWRACIGIDKRIRFARV